MRGDSYEAIIASLGRSAQALRKIAGKRELPGKFRRDFGRFAKKGEVLTGRFREGELSIPKAVLLRQGAWIIVENACLVPRRQRLGLNPDWGLKKTRQMVQDTADYIETGRKPKRWRSKVGAHK